jgi:hypothetical protein
MLKRAARSGRRSIQDQIIKPMAQSYKAPPPPSDISGPEQYVWDNMLKACPPGWFTPDLQPLLKQFCAVAVWKSKLEATWRANDFKFDDGGVEYEKAIKIFLSLLTKMRLTPKSRNKRKPAAARIRNHVTKVESTWYADEDEAQAA